MKITTPVIVIFVAMIGATMIALLSPLDLNAAKVYTWTDENGKMHISEEPPPENASIKDVINYEPESEIDAGKEESSKALPDESGNSQAIEKIQQDALDARKAADEAAREAQEARKKADQAAKNSKDYIRTRNRNKYMLPKDTKQTRKPTREAEIAIEQAQAAEEKARSAEERAIKAEKKAREAAARRAD